MSSVLHFAIPIVRTLNNNIKTELQKLNKRGKTVNGHYSPLYKLYKFHQTIIVLILMTLPQKTP